jgi:uncharacterized protein YqeY
MSSTYETLRADIIVSMKARDSATTLALRTADAAIKRAAMDANKEIDEALVVATMRKAVKNLADARAEFEKGGRADLVAANDAEIKILEKYLPKGLDAAKVDELINAAIASTIFSSTATSGKSIATLRNSRRNRPSEMRNTLALCTAVTFLPRVIAHSKARRAMRSQHLAVTRRTAIAMSSVGINSPMPMCMLRSA